MKPMFYQLDFITLVIEKIQPLAHRNRFEMDVWSYRDMTGDGMVFRSYDEFVVRDLQRKILYDRELNWQHKRTVAESAWDEARLKKKAEDEATTQ